MKIQVQLSLTMLIITTIAACSDSNEISGTTEAENSSQIERISSRSPQGIPDNGRDRRERTQKPRHEGQFPERHRIDNVEVRTYDGTSNNTKNIEWGATYSQLQRLADAAYSNGVSNMIQTDRAGPREISNTLINQKQDESIPNPYGTSDFLWQWGQFIDHDIDLTDGSSNEAQNIQVPIGDPYFDPAGTGSVIIQFNRALFDPDTGTDATNVRQQENEISSWIDGSMVYGSSNERAVALRVGPNSPYLKTSSGDLLPFNRNSITNANGPLGIAKNMFLAGDIRANEQVGLTSMHTLFVREHNRLARLLSNADNNASSESIFQSARRLLIAEIQIITYNEFLPALVGPKAIPAYIGYDSSINPTIYNEFSTAAYRLGHSMVSEQILRIDSNSKTIPEGPLKLQRMFFTAPELLKSKKDIDPILRGLASQIHQAIDIKVIHPLRNLLFGKPGAGALDLAALNIQRGRDHGLPSYNDMRIAMDLTPVSKFEEIGKDAQIQQSLQDTYGDVSNLDLWIGGLAESPLTKQGSQLGELFQAIIVKQFTELRDGDRFWYQHYLDNKELDLIRNVTLAKIIRNNTNIGEELQDNVFYVKR